MTIRAPTMGESLRVVQLMDEGLRGVDAAYDALTRSAPRRWLARCVTLPAYFHILNEGWILEESGQIRGWLYLLHRQRSTHINDIGVATAFRGRGYGHRLIEWAHARARANGKEALTLAVTGTNTPAISLYERNGFRAFHHYLWKGARHDMPQAPTPLLARELSRDQRPEPFEFFWTSSLRADQQPIAPMLVDQISYWFTERGRAWELWESTKRVGYADHAGDGLRLFLQNPQDRSMLHRGLATLRPLVPRGPVMLDLGSNTADEAARSFLGPGWIPVPRERMLMTALVARDEACQQAIPPSSIAP